MKTIMLHGWKTGEIHLVNPGKIIYGAPHPEGGSKLFLEEESWVWVKESLAQIHAMANDIATIQFGGES